MKHHEFPPWDDPRLSPEQRREEWLIGHFRPEYLRRDPAGRLQADFEGLRSWRRRRRESVGVAGKSAPT